MAARRYGSDTVTIGGKKIRAWNQEAERVYSLLRALPAELKPRAWRMLVDAGYPENDRNSAHVVENLCHFSRDKLLSFEYAVRFLRANGRMPGE